MIAANSLFNIIEALKRALYAPQTHIQNAANLLG